MNKFDIKALVVGIVEEYGTNNPFDLINEIGIPVLFHSLPDCTNAYHLEGVLVINKNLSYENQKWLLAHELGHYFIHGPEATLGRYLSNNLLIREKVERQADYFASELLLADIDNYTIEGLTSKQLASLFNVPEKYVKYKLAK